jgi:aspartate/methionine/tyrosine aminotransferase
MALTLSSLGTSVRAMEYAVRGPIVARAQALERSGRTIIYCNIGNPQALGQKPLSHVRQLLALMEWPDLAEKAAGAFPADVIATARQLLDESRAGLGAYSESKGLKTVRQAVAEFITRRDGPPATPVSDPASPAASPADPEHIFLTDGASKGVQAALRLLIAGTSDGIMIPIPQYPLYSATITLYGGRQVGYFLDESGGWSLSRPMLEEALRSAELAGTRVKAICVINPGNPTGAVLSRENIAMVIGFAREHGLSILADEVYQENIYRPGDRFVSFAKVLSELGERETSLFSFHSCSKGLLGECGQRGGYMEVRNVPEDVMAEITKLQSVSLCANLPGQILVRAMVKPPVPGDPSWPTWDAERRTILESLKERSRILAEGLNAIPGYSCQPIAGAMYAFPTVRLPAGRTDEQYCMALLEETGICVVPGTGFGQQPGTAHFRTTILPPKERIEEVVEKIASFHRSWK